MLNKEEWKAIPGYEGLYEVSSEGKVRSLNYRGTGKVRVLKLSVNRYGYLQVHLCKEGKVKNYRVNRLVAQAFIPNPNNLPEVNHIDEIKTNNRVENLEWCDRQYNMSYGTGNERAGKAHRKPVICLETGQVFSSLTEAALYIGYSQGSLSTAIIKGYKAKGYHWIYI